MNTGIIKSKPAGKPFAFIKVEGQEKEIFFHESEVTDPVGFAGLNEGDTVTFDTKQDPQGRTNATNVKKSA
jgi:cold shock CspA family protein